MKMIEVKYEIRLETYYGSDQKWNGTLLVSTDSSDKHILEEIFRKNKSSMGERDLMSRKILSKEIVEFERKVFV